MNTLVIEDDDFFNNFILVFPYDMILAVHHDDLGLRYQLYVFNLSRIDQYRFPV